MGGKNVVFVTFVVVGSVAGVGVVVSAVGGGGDVAVLLVCMCVVVCVIYRQMLMSGPLEPQFLFATKKNIFRSC